MNRRNRMWMGGAAVLGAGIFAAGPLRAAAQEGDDWVAEALSGLVTDGTLTQAQADAVDEALDAARPERAADGPGGRIHHGHGGGRFGVRLALDEAATAIGIEPDALRDAVRDGQTLAEVAAANGVDEQVVIDAMVAEVQTRLDEAVADGRLDATEAGTRLTEATERITTLVNEGFPVRHDRTADDTDTTDDTDPTTPESTTPPTTTG